LGLDVSFFVYCYSLSTSLHSLQSWSFFMIDTPQKTKTPAQSTKKRRARKKPKRTPSLDAKKSLLAVLDIVKPESFSAEQSDVGQIEEVKAGEGLGQIEEVKASEGLGQIEEVRAGEGGQVTMTTERVPVQAKKPVARLYSVSEISKITRLKVGTIRRWFQQGRVKDPQRLGINNFGHWYATGKNIYECLVLHGWKLGNPFEEEGEGGK